MSEEHKVIYCHCAYAHTIPKKIKTEVLEKLTEAGVSFEMVPDLCEMSAKKDPELKAKLEGGPRCVVACYKRAVKWLCHSADVNFDEDMVEVLNMREMSAEDIVDTVKASSI